MTALLSRPGTFNGIAKIEHFDAALPRTFDRNAELADIAIRGIDHQIIHNVQEEIQSLFKVQTFSPEFYQTMKFPFHVPDPRKTLTRTPWLNLPNQEKIDVLCESLAELGKLEDLRRESDFSLAKVLKFYERILERAQDLDTVIRNMPKDWLETREGLRLLRRSDSVKRMLKAQIDICNPPERFVEMDLAAAAKESTRIRTFGPNAFPIGFLELAGLPKGACLVHGQYDLILRAITECAKNSYRVALAHESGPNPYIENPRYYKASVSLKYDPNGCLELCIQDNCGGIPDKLLAPDKHGIPSRPLMCNAATTTTGGGVGTCELFYIAKALKAELKVENWEDPDSIAKGAKVTLTFPPFTRSYTFSAGYWADF